MAVLLTFGLSLASLFPMQPSAAQAYTAAVYTAPTNAAANAAPANAAAYAPADGSGVGIVLDGRPLTADVPAQIVNDRTLVPVRAIAEALGGRVSWQPDGRKVRIERNGDHVELAIGSPVLSKNGMTLQMDVPAMIISDRTLVPLRFVSEGLGIRVNWLANARTVLLQSAPARPYQVWGYHVQYAARDRLSQNSAEAHENQLDGLISFTYALQADGNVATVYAPEELLEWARRNGKPVQALVHNQADGDFDPDIAHAVLADPAARDRAVANLVALVNHYGFSGLNLDIEAVSPDDRQGYTAFAAALSQRLHAAGKQLSLSVPAKTSDSPRAQWSGAYDYAALGRLADQVILMVYDEHYAGGPAGPLASAPWAEAVIRYATSTMPSQKVFLGVGAYGYEWPLQGGRARTVTQSAAKQRLQEPGVTYEWDEAALSPSFRTDATIAYYEDDESLRCKLDLIDRYRLGGLAVWRLGLEDESFWQVVAERPRF